VSDATDDMLASFTYALNRSPEEGPDAQT